MVLDVTRDVAEKAEPYKRSARGHRLELDDRLVAATAFVHKAVLATGNGKHYPPATNAATAATAKEPVTQGADRIAPPTGRTRVIIFK